MSRRAVRNRQAVTFRGRVRTLPAAGGGKLVELQVRLSHRWETFRTTRTDADRSLVDPLPVQARLPRRADASASARACRREAGYPFDPGSSRRVRVRVTGHR